MKSKWPLKGPRGLLMMGSCYINFFGPSTWGHRSAKDVVQIWWKSTKGWDVVSIPDIQEVGVVPARLFDEGRDGRVNNVEEFEAAAFRSPSCSPWACPAFDSLQMRFGPSCALRMGVDNLNSPLHDPSTSLCIPTHLTHWLSSHPSLRTFQVNAICFLNLRFAPHLSPPSFCDPPPNPIISTLLGRLPARLPIERLLCTTDQVYPRILLLSSFYTFASPQTICK